MTGTRFVIRLHKHGGWFVVDTADTDREVRGPFETSKAAQIVANRLNAGVTP